MSRTADLKTVHDEPTITMALILIPLSNSIILYHINNKRTCGIEKSKRALMHVFLRFQLKNNYIYYYIFRSLKCPLHIASYTLRIGVSFMEL